MQLNNDLLNYWNFKQVVYIKGKKNATFDENIIFKKLLEQEYI